MNKLIQLSKRIFLLVMMVSFAVQASAKEIKDKQWNYKLEIPDDYVQLEVNDEHGLWRFSFSNAESTAWFDCYYFKMVHNSSEIMNKNEVLALPDTYFFPGFSQYTLIDSSQNGEDLTSTYMATLQGATDYFKVYRKLMANAVFIAIMESRSGDFSVSDTIVESLSTDYFQLFLNLLSGEPMYMLLAVFSLFMAPFMFGRAFRIRKKWKRILYFIIGISSFVACNFWLSFDWIGFLFQCGFFLGGLFHNEKDDKKNSGYDSDDCPDINIAHYGTSYHQDFLS